MTENLGPGWAPKKPPPSGDGEPAPKPRRFWWRFALASLLIVAISAGTTAAATLLYLDSIANAIQPKNDKLQKRLNKFLADAGDGGAQTFLVIGSDKRANEAEDPGRSDTTMLVRLDPDKSLISMMSIPRDLKVEIPGYGTGKFNEAYAYGGTKLTLETVKDLTDLPINHIVNVDFLGFAQGVYAIGCVYVDIDRRYYHSNVESAEQYAEINVQPGYQLMCGKQALDYVRYRHTDTDIVRSARQQDFLSAARSRISVQDLVFDQGELVEAFTDYTTSDISDGKTLLEVLKLLGASRNSTINEVNFPAELGPSFVYTTPGAVEAAVQEFLGGETTQEAKAAQRQSREEAEAGRKKHKKQPKKKQKPKKPKVEVAKPGSDGLVPASEAGEAEAKIAARRARGFFPVYYPTRLPEGTRFVESDPYEKVVDPYVYNLKDEDGNRHVAYRMVLVAEMSDGTHYFGVQGIRGWSDPPILEDPSLTKTIHGRDYDIYVDGENVKMVAWRRGDNVYWVSNDLLRTLTNDQMIGMARSAKVLVPTKKKKPKPGRSRG
ncbi:MAG: polyisoprenyl-teichoic acid--peptidoglycan teichoic acid transferase [Solirubrobacterales bacterium]|jgi:LCP family protein required for cell wall assembly|nr:polyisoprenyl-teichoic acid--peptidoglycan teichoic acid transferase [Solirubrobacterales bacterium]